MINFFDLFLRVKEMKTNLTNGIKLNSKAVAQQSRTEGKGEGNPQSGRKCLQIKKLTNN